MSREEFYERVEELMNEKGWTEYRLSKEANVSVTTIYSCFQKHPDLQYETFMKIIRGLNVPISVFFKEKDINTEVLTLEQGELIEITKGLGANDMRRIIAYARALKDAENNE